MTITKFPDEFEALLNKQGRKILTGTFESQNFTQKSNTPIEVIKNIIDTDVSNACMKILDDNFYLMLNTISTKIDKNEMLKMKVNYSEKLPKNLRMKTLEIGGKKSRSYELAHNCGLIQMLNSESLKAFGEAIAKEKFGSASNNQIICYGNGDYVSPHNDHHPENSNIKNGYFDFHIMFSNEHVHHQLLVHEKSGYLNGYYDISTPSAIAVYKLPFWHYTTPLIGKNKRESMAKRWLLLRSFECYNN